MNRLRGLLARIAGIFGRRRHDADLAAELESHLQFHIDENIGRGMSHQEARRQALIHLGGVEQTKEICRERRGLPWLDSLLQDLRFGLRMLRKKPGFTAVAVITLALGIGANTAIFSVVNAVLLRPLPIKEPSRVMYIEEPSQGFTMNLTPATLADVQSQNLAFESVGASSDASFNLASQTAPERVQGKLATAGYFTTFGVRPLAGRTFTADEDAPGQPLVVVISERLWRAQLNADPGIIGQSLHINGLGYTVIGIMPGSFDPYLDNSELWIPEAFTPHQLADRGDHSCDTVARLKPGVAITQAQSELKVIASRIEKLDPVHNKDHTLRAVPLATALLGSQRLVLQMMVAAVGFLLLIASANVANLQLARSRLRQKEIALRAALGASPQRIVRQLFAENAVLAIMGGFAGVLLAWAAVTWIALHGPNAVPRLAQTSIDKTVLIFASTIALLSSIAFGLAPALRSASPRLSEAFKGTTGASGGTRDWLRNALVTSEFALALVLMAGAGLFVRSALLLSHTDPGFDASDLMVGRVGLPDSSYHDPAVARATFEQITAAARDLPGVQSASMVSRAPMAGGITGNGVIPEGKPINAKSVVIARLQIVSPGYFSTMRIMLKAGRDFAPSETRATRPTAIVNETLARTLWPGQNPIGKRFACCEAGPKGDADPAWHEVIGVAADVRTEGLNQEILPEFYLPLAQIPSDAWDWIGRTMDLVVRSKAESIPMSELQTVVASVAPGVPVYQASTMRQKIAGTIAKSQFETFLLSIFAATALALSSVGIYGLLSFLVAERTREIGVRMALGATHRRVVREVMGHGLRLTVLGLAIGLAGALAGTRLLSSLLFGVGPTDALTLAVVSILLVAVALAASYLPARRAGQVDPMIALRHN